MNHETIHQLYDYISKNFVFVKKFVSTVLDYVKERS